MSKNSVIFSFDGDNAEKYGWFEALLIQYFRNWTNWNREQNKNFYDGRYWTYTSINGLCERFFFVSKSKIERAIKHLENEGVLLVGNYNNSPYDRTKWYTMAEDETVENSDSVNLTESIPSDCGNQFHQNDGINSIRMTEPIPIINTSNNPTYKRKSKKERDRYEDVPEELVEPLKEFEKMRKSIKKPMTDRAFSMLLAKVKDLSEGNMELAVKIIEQSILNSWASVYPLKDERRWNDKNNNGVASNIEPQRTGVDWNSFTHQFED